MSISTPILQSESLESSLTLWERRRLALARALSSDRTRLPEFSAWLADVTPQYTWDWPYSRLIQQHLDKMTAGEIGKLMLFIPPRHGKSELASVRYPVYRLCRDPKTRVIIGAYNQTLAESFARKARRIAAGRVELDTSRMAANDWQTVQGGGVRAVGVGGGVTGHGGDLIVIDDPVKNREEAESETYRERCWDWYTDDLYTRLEPGGTIILIMTRWHEDDLAGRIMASDKASDWTVLSLPAVAEEGDLLGRDIGEALCPDRFDEAALLDIRETQGSYSFTALYQQRPAPAEGARFRRSWFRYFDVDAEHYYLYHADGDRRVVAKDTCWYFTTVDAAATESEQSDYFVASTWAVTERRELLLVDVFRERAETTKHESILQPIIERWQPRFVGIEKVTFGLNIIQRLRVLGVPVVDFKADRDKLSRSLPIQARYEGGGVYHPKRASWLSYIEDELLSFPVGKYDDFVDTASYAGIWLAQYVPWQDTSKPEEDWSGRTPAAIEARIRKLEPPQSDEEYY